MNKIYKVVWNKARNCYVVGSEFISSHSTGKTSTIGSKSLAAALAVCAVCSMGTVFAEEPSEPSAGTTKASQYVAFSTKYAGTLPTDYTDDKNGYYVRDGYKLEVNENGGKYTDLSANSRRVTVKLTGGSSMSKDLLESTTAINSNTGTITSLNESLQKITLGSFVGVSHGGGVEVPEIIIILLMIPPGNISLALRLKATG